MSVSKIILFVLLVSLSPFLYAQNFIFSKSATEFRFDYPVLGLFEDKINYDKIKGSPFWVDEYQQALLYSTTGYVGTFPVRINFATGELYFLKDSAEMVLVDNFITRVVFKTGNDSSIFIGKVPNLLLNNKPLEGFAQVLTAGKYQLLKYTKRIVTSEESPSHTSRSYHFTDAFVYFIKSNEKVELIKKLNRESILHYLPASSGFDAWIKKSDINFRYEKDIVRFLNYYNSKVNQ